MKRKSLLKTALLTAVGIGLLTAHTQAATTTYAVGDLFIGFYDASNNATKDYLYNIGQASIYRDAAANSTISLGNVGTDLVSTFGSDWNLNQDIRWFVFGTTYNTAAGSDPSFTLYASSEEALLGTPNMAYEVGSTSTQGVIAGPMWSVGQSFKNLTASGAMNTLAQNTTATNSFYSMSSGVQVFNAYVSGGFGEGTANSVLDLFRMRGDLSSATGELGSYEGKFTINDSGAITFKAAAAVPEPSTYLLLLTGAALFVVLRRRRKVQSA